MSRNKSKPLSEGGSRKTRIRHIGRPIDPRVIQAPWGDIPLDEFFDGRSDYRKVAGEELGGFSGRPKLAEELGSVLREFCKQGARLTFEMRISAMRWLWRTLDESEKLGVLTKVDSVNDFTIDHGFHVQRSIPGTSSYKATKTLVQSARRVLGLTELSWPASASDEPLTEKDLPTQYAVNTVYFALKQKVRLLHERWDSCSALAARGTDLSRTEWTTWDSRRSGIKKWSLENQIATYAAFNAKAADFVDAEQVNKHFETDASAATAMQLREIGSYFFPVKVDALHHLRLLLLQTGWNAQVAIDLDINSPDLATPHPTAKPKIIFSTNPDTGELVKQVFPLMLLRGAKSRSGGHLQSALSNSHQSVAAYPLLMRYVRQTEELRKRVLRTLATAEKELEKRPQDRKLELEVYELRKDSVSPWLYMAGAVGEERNHPSPRPIMRLSLQNYHAGSLDQASWPSFIAEINAEITARIAENERRLRSKIAETTARMTQLNADHFSALAQGSVGEILKVSEARLATKSSSYKTPALIPKTFTLSVLRDVFINNAYTSSGFNIFVAQAAAGHRSGSSLRNYLHNQVRRRRNYARGRTFQDHLFSEMRRGVVDPVVLRKLMDDGQITDEQRDRWLAYRDRTRQGTGCKNSKRPPEEIAPDHKLGETCRIQRCVICSNALVFQDSLDPIACRIAELIRIQMITPLLVWSNSSFRFEHDVAVATLAQPEFDAGEVVARVAFWSAEIADGRHIIADMEGTYG